MGSAHESYLSVTNQLQSDEIDVVAIGPPGVQVIEVKHWTAQWVDTHLDLVRQEAERVANKARKIGTTLRRIVVDLPRVDGVILLTQDPSKVKKLARRNVKITVLPNQALRPPTRSCETCVPSVSACPQQ